MNAPVKDIPELEPRPLYGIGTVARLTGLKPDTLRVWERRYGLGASYKSPSGRRQYTQADLEHLQLIAALVEASLTPPITRSLCTNSYIIFPGNTLSGQ